MISILIHDQNEAVENGFTGELDEGQEQSGDDISDASYKDDWYQLRLDIGVLIFDNQDGDPHVE